MKKLALIVEPIIRRRQVLSLLLNSLGFEAVVVNNIACLKEKNFFKDQKEIKVSFVLLSFNVRELGFDICQITKRAQEAGLKVILIGQSFLFGLNCKIDAFLLEPLEREILKNLLF